jgi:hypothetical protein
MKKKTLLIATVAFMVVALAAPAMAAHAGPMIVGDAITEEFELEPGEVQELHDMGIGYGAIFKLQVYAYALGITVEELLATLEVDPETGEYVFNFGELEQSLTEEQLALLDDLPQNLGEIVSAAARPDHAGEGKPDGVGEGKPDGVGQGKPSWAGDGDDDDNDDDT